jgi:hypothetical protein
MLKKEVKGAVVSNEVDRILVLQIPNLGVKVFYWDDSEGYQETLKPPELKTLDEGIKKAEKELEIQLEYSKIFHSESFRKLSPKKTQKIEDNYDRKLKRVWA